MEKLLPRPLRPHGEGGEQSVRSPPATGGHICGQLSPLLPSGPLGSPPSLFPLSLTHSNPKIGLRERCTLSSLITHPPHTPPSPYRLFILMGVTREKGSPPFFAEADEKDLATSAQRYTTARHTPARMNDFPPLAPSRSDAHTEKPGERGTRTHTHTHRQTDTHSQSAVNNGNMCFSRARASPEGPGGTAHSS